MRPFRLSRAARSDIVQILIWSEERFGSDARNRYRSLIDAAIADLRTDPERAGSSPRPDLGKDIRAWHLRLSRTNSAGNPVRKPRHFVIYRVEDGLIAIGRVLHDAMDLEQHIDPAETWE